MEKEKKILSQDDIGKLLNAISTGEKIEEPPVQRKIKIYDFKRPDVLSREMLFATMKIFEIFCKNYASLLSKKTKKECSYRVSSIDQLTFEEFIRSIPPFSPMFLAKGDFGQVIVEVDPEIVFAMFDMVQKEDEAKLNEADEKEKFLNIPLRELSDSEMTRFKKEIQEPFMAVLKKTLTKDLDKSTNFESNIKKWNVEKYRFEKDSLYCKAMAPGEMICLVSISAVFDGVNGMINLCFPYKEIIKITNEARGIKEMAGEKSIDMNLVQNTTVPVEVVLGSTNKTLKEVSGMGEGTIIELDRLAGTPVDVKVNGKIVGHGEVVVIDENFGVCLTDFVRD